MKILHICLAAFYVDNYSYQENMLPKYHKRLGYDVSILASLQAFDENGNACFLEKESEYINEHEIPVKRIKYKNIIDPLAKKLKIYYSIYNILENKQPDIIFIHGCQFSNMKDIKKYAINNPKVKIFVDNHCDFSNSATNWFSKNILHRVLWKHSAKMIEPYTTKFYGVLPARVDFIIDMYKVNPNKVELLVMGADDEKIDEVHNYNFKKSVRDNYGVKEDDFLIVTGGKIDAAKTQTLLLMDAISRINKPKVKLIVFGSVTQTLKNDLMNLCDGEKIQYIGWIQSQNSYKYFAAADLVVFPGRHSVFWEQVVGLGIPMIVKYWSGSTHVDVGGNCKFLYHDTVDEIKGKLLSIIDNSEEYNKMKKIATNNGIDKFSYKRIAMKSIQY